MAKKKIDDETSVSEESPTENQESESVVEEKPEILTDEMKQKIKEEIASHLKDRPPVTVEESDDDETWKTLHEQDERIADLERVKKKKKHSLQNVGDWIAIAFTIIIIPLGAVLLVWDYKNRIGRWPWQKTS